MSTRDERYFAAYSRRNADAGRSELGSRLSIRPAEIMDVEGLAALCQEREGGPLGTYLERFAKEITEHPNWLDRLLIVALVDDFVAGFGRATYFQASGDHPANVAPSGWYLGGVIVAMPHRRMGIGLELTRRRLQWIAARSDEAFFIVNAQNRASMDLHARIGFREVTRDFSMPGVSFRGGVGILFRVGVGSV